MDSMYGQDVAMSIDMDELGVRPLNWIDISKDFDDSINDYFGKEKTVDFTVYSAELQSINNGKKLTTNDDETSMSDDDDNSNDYDIDPETGMF
jgi:preprotein translocase subunit Sec63